MALDNVLRTLTEKFVQLRNEFDEYKRRDTIAIDRTTRTPVLPSQATGIVSLNADKALVSSAAFAHDSANTALLLNAARLQHLITSGTSFARVFVGYNATWNYTTNVWDIGAIGANDCGGLLFDNNSINVRLIIHPSTGATARTMTHAQFLDGTVAIFKTAGLQDEAWINPTLLNSWTNYGSGFYDVQYRKTANGHVQLRGLVGGGSVNTTIFTLPTGYRPLKRALLSTISNTGVARVDVHTTGNVDLISGGTTFVSLDTLFVNTD
jgi:hypothetical protein